MYVKKFEGETLDSALKAVKMELGPDAIILKTVTNKGLKGAFKKGRIEITAAISEGSYAKKNQVDQVLNEDQKEQFYRAPAQRVNNMINDYNEHKSDPAPRPSSSYGNMGLNKVVNTVSNKIKNSLDDFLSMDEGEHYQEKNENHFDVRQQETSQKEANLGSFRNRALQDQQRLAEQREREENLLKAREDQEEHYHAQKETESELRQLIKSQKHQIELLEQKIFEISEKVSETRSQDDEPKGVKGLRSTLRSLELSEPIVQSILKKAVFELSYDEQDDPDTIYEFALREIHSLIHVEMPLFSKTDVQDESVVTVLLSEASVGQTSMAMKLAALQENAKVIRFREGQVENNQHDFTAKVFNLDITNVSSLAHLMSEARKVIEEKRPLLLDLRLEFKEVNESKKIIETLKRSFNKVEFLLNLSSLHSELYNRKTLSKFHKYLNGVNFTYVDQCLSFGSILNLHYEHNQLPLKFFGTGAVVPEDIEMASTERIMAELFKL